MRLATIFLLLSFSECNFSQTKPVNIDSFKDYSYLLILAKKTQKKDSFNVTGIGTGFFVRNENKLYLVSANHIFTGNDPFSVIRIDSTTPDLMVFRYSREEKDTVKSFYLDS